MEKRGTMRVSMLIAHFGGEAGMATSCAWRGMTLNLLGKFLRVMWPTKNAYNCYLTSI